MTRLWLILLGILACGLNPAAAQRLSISASALPSRLEAALMGSARYVYLDGEIDADAAKRFETFVAANDIPYTSTVVMNSPGGSLVAGIELGRAIRKRGFTTDVGTRIKRDGRDGYEPGICMSACTLAFIGGRFRHLSDGSRFGVHRFYFTKRSDDASDIAQMMSALVVAHIRDMEVDTALFTLSTKAGRGGMFEPDRDTMQSLKIINNGYTDPRWTIEGANGLIYLKGERDTVHGINKFIVYCQPNSSPMLHVIFDPQGRNDEVMGAGAHSIVFDYKDTPIRPASRKIVNDWFNVSYVLSRSHIANLMRSSSVGLMVRHSYESPMFLGFDHFPINTQEQRTKSYLHGCGR